MSSDFRFYTWKKCSTCRDAQKALDSSGIRVDERDFFEDRLSEAELNDLLNVVPLEELFSWRSPSTKPYRARRKEISDGELVKLMLGEPRLIRRPILVSSDGAVVVGFKPGIYSELARQ